MRESKEHEPEVGEIRSTHVGSQESVQNLLWKT
jgi:hypothetical protein